MKIKYKKVRTNNLPFLMLHLIPSKIVKFLKASFLQETVVRQGWWLTKMFTLQSTHHVNTSDHLFTMNVWRFSIIMMDSCQHERPTTQAWLMVTTWVNTSSSKLWGKLNGVGKSAYYLWNIFAANFNMAPNKKYRKTN